MTNITALINPYNATVVAQEAEKLFSLQMTFLIWGRIFFLIASAFCFYMLINEIFANILAQYGKKKEIEYYKEELEKLKKLRGGS